MMNGQKQYVDRYYPAAPEMIPGSVIHENYFVEKGFILLYNAEGIGSIKGKGEIIPRGTSDNLKNQHASRAGLRCGNQHI